MPDSIHALLAGAEKILRKARVPEPRVEAEVLLAEIAGTKRTELLLTEGFALGQQRRQRFEKLILRRVKTREPLAYILGTAWFLDFELKVTPEVLVPRPETELLVEKVLEIFQKKDSYDILDVGTGSGAIAVALAHYLPHALVAAFDLSRPALVVAKANAAKHNVLSRIKFFQGDLLNPWMEHKMPSADIIVANLPYIPEQSMPQLPLEVKHEPKMALDGGKEGLEVYTRFLPQGYQALKRSGTLFLEIGYNQRVAMETLLKAQGFDGIQAFKDYSGHDRIMIAQKQ